MYRPVDAERRVSGGSFRNFSRLHPAMSVISFRIERDSRGGWSNRSDLTLHLEDWDLAMFDDRITGRPRAESLFWRIVTMALFLWLAWMLLIELTPILWFGSSVSAVPVVPRPRDGLVIAHTWGLLLQPQQPANRQQLEAELRQSQERMLESLERADPGARERVEQAVQEDREQAAARRREQDARMARIDRIVQIVSWCVSPLVVLLGLVFAWIGYRYGLREILRFPFDRVRIDVQNDPDTGQPALCVTRARIRRPLQVTRPLQRVSAVQLSVRKIGRRRARSYSSPRWHWVATLHSERASGLPRIEFFLESRPTEPSSRRKPPGRTRRFLKSLCRMTGAPLART